MELINRIYQDRFDMSDHLIHFTRDNNEESAFQILKKIVHSGRINCGWSERNTRRTIFGNNPAVCFTEMPLIGLINYVKNRDDLSKIDFYGVAMSKKYMFNHGARNVIYGLTRGTDDATILENGVRITPHLPEEEQYRYMLTGIKDLNDWTHEREWRWKNVYNWSEGDYFPVWKMEQPIKYGKKYHGDYYFSVSENIFVLVRTVHEAEELKTLFLTYNYPKYNLENIERTYILPLENISLETIHNVTNLNKLIDDQICIRIHRS